MRYKVVLQHSDEGVSVSVPGLPGCWSQGRDEAEAVKSTKDALREYLVAADTQVKGTEFREIEVAV